MIDHEETAAAYPIQTRDFHLSEQLVDVGERVRRRQLIACSERSGMAGAFPHLYFDLHRPSAAEPPAATGVLDPQRSWVDGTGRITCYDRDRDWLSTPLALIRPVPCLGLEWRQ